MIASPEQPDNASAKDAAASPEVYQGQFGEFTITQSDRTGVIVYRTSLVSRKYFLFKVTW